MAKVMDVSGSLAPADKAGFPGEVNVRVTRRWEILQDNGGFYVLVGSRKMYVSEDQPKIYQEEHRYFIEACTLTQRGAREKFISKDGVTGSRGHKGAYIIVDTCLRKDKDSLEEPKDIANGYILSMQDGATLIFDTKVERQGFLHTVRLARVVVGSRIGLCWSNKTTDQLLVTQGFQSIQSILGLGAKTIGM